MADESITSSLPPVASSPQPPPLLGHSPADLAAAGFAKALDKLGRFHGIWLSKKVLVIGGCVLLFLVGCAVVWAIRKTASEADHRLEAERRLEEVKQRLEAERQRQENRQWNAPGKAIGSDYRTQSWLNPRDSFVGEIYTLHVNVTNTSNRFIRFTATVISVPIGDLLLSPAIQSVVVAPGGSNTLLFNIDCGVEGGRVLYDSRASWAD